MRTNKFSLPDRVCKVIDGLNPPRPAPTNEVIHVTDLLLPANARRLCVENYDKIVRDYSDWLISCQGDAIHEAFKKYLGEEPGHLAELKLEKKFGSVLLVGTCDLFLSYEKHLCDLKQTAVWSPGYKIPDYTIQTNCYAHMLRSKGYEVDKISIDVIYRNWKLKDMGWNKDYPKYPYEEINIEVWDDDKVKQFIEDQIEYLLMCKEPCSRADKWQKYAAMRSVNGKEKQNPDKNFDDRAEAEKWIESWTPAASCLKSAPKGKVTWRLSDTPPLNCLNYCPARSVCSYAKKLK